MNISRWKEPRKITSELNTTYTPGLPPLSIEDNIVTISKINGGGTEI